MHNLSNSISAVVRHFCCCLLLSATVDNELKVFILIKAEGYGRKSRTPKITLLEHINYNTAGSPSYHTPADIMIVLLLYFHNKFQLNIINILVNDDNKQE